MKKNNFFRIYCAAFIGICLVPAVCTPFLKSESKAEKRSLSEFPSLKTEEGDINMKFTSEFDTWFSEHFAFREQLVTADGRTKTTLFRTSPEENVIFGKNGWLYYSDTVNDYLNINTLSQREINNIRHNLRMIDDYCKEQGAEFLFFSAPNKNSLYPENMPFNYVPAENKNNYTLVSEALSDDEFFIDMKDVLLSAESSIPLYHKTDTHWNNLGAYVGHTAIMNRLGLAPLNVGDEWYTKNNRLGDLAEMVYPSEKAKDTQVYHKYTYKYKYQGFFKGLDDVIIDTVNSEATGDLLMFRDSYGEAILPYMAECFNVAEFSRAVPYKLNNIQGKTVIIEIVERNLGNLQKYAPIMPAPVVDIKVTDFEEADEDFICKKDESGLYNHIYGVLPECYFSGESHNIYIEAGGVTYKAFNCYEDKLLEDEGNHSGNGFSLYIPLENSIDDIKATVINSDGKIVASRR